MRILVARNRIYWRDRPVETYSSSMVRSLRELGHEVLDVPKPRRNNYDGIDLVIDVDCGRNEKGELVWQGTTGRLPVPSAVMFIDSHGYPGLHRVVGKNYDHVFFAVWDKRDLFADHPSAHWCPNFTDRRWFDGKIYGDPFDFQHFDFGFFGSKGGLDRAKPMMEIANNNKWKAVARQVSPGNKHRWPETQQAMAQCRNLFNHGQKHDGPNLRVMESMLMHRPLISDQDPRSGMDKLFVPWEEYVPYEAYTYKGLEDAMGFLIKNRDVGQEIATRAYENVMSNHLVENRINQILEVVRGSV